MSVFPLIRYLSRTLSLSLDSSAKAEGGALKYSLRKTPSSDTVKNSKCKKSDEEAMNKMYTNLLNNLFGQVK